MSKKKQIWEIAKDLCQNAFCSLEEWNKCKLKVGEYCANCRCMAERLYNAGYRKQSEGEWIERCVTLSWLEDDVDVFYVCSACKIETPFTSKFCPDCGAKMKGGAE